MKKIYLLIFILFLLGLSQQALADEGACPAGQICNPLNSGTIPELIDKIGGFIYWIAIIVAPLMIIIAGFYFLTAAGNPNRIATAKNIILWTVVGLVIVLFSKGLISLIKGFLGG